MDDKYAELEKYFDGRYVLKDACSNRHEKLDDKIDEIKTEQTKIATKLDIIAKSLWAIFATCLAAVATSVMSMILK